MARIEYGLQLYSVRDITKVNFQDALKQVAAMGYKYVEPAGFFESKAEDVKAWLDEYGLICSGTHTGMGALEPENIDATIAYHKAIGCKNLIVPGADWSTQEKMDYNIDLLNAAQKKLAENGIVLGYHNHSREFFPTEYGKIIEDEIIARTTVEVEIDTFWAFNAGLNPIEICEKYKNRIRVIHLKDGFPSADDCKNYQHVHDGVQGKSVGSGKAPVKAVREWAIANNILMVIESEGLDPTGPEEAKRCIDFLRTLD